MSIKILVFDLETSGTQHWKHCIHQLSAMVVIDDVPRETLNLFIRPHEKAQIDPQALKVSNVTEEQIQQYPHRSQQFTKFLELLNRYVNPFDSADKFTLAGFKNASFDDEFLRKFFILEENDRFGAYFFSNSIDVSCLASQYLLPDRHRLPSFQLQRCCKYVGIEVIEENLHSSLYDCELTWELYKVVRGKTIDDF